MKELYNPGNLYGWNQALEGTKYQDKRKPLWKNYSGFIYRFVFPGDHVKINK